MEGYLDIIIFVALMATGYFAGTYNERRHYRSIRERETAFLYLPAVTMKHVDFDQEKVLSAEMVSGNVVISVDYFKRILAGLRKIFGGQLRSYETLIDRARREAVLRMKESAPCASIIVNVRVDTAPIGNKAGGKGIGCVEVFAYGTALTLES